jgi:hypothetical protein
MANNQIVTTVREEGGEDGEVVVGGLVVLVVLGVLGGLGDHLMTLMMMMMTIMVDTGIEEGIQVAIKIIMEPMAMLRLEVHPLGL